MGFSDIFNSVVGYFTSDRQNADLGASLDLFKTYLNSDQNETIRMWVSDAPGYGHQSSTVNLIFQLTNTQGSPLFGFGYEGEIDVYYLQDKDKTVLKKLFELLPSLNNQATGGKVNEATVNLIEWKDGDAAPTPVVNLGFTGAEDQVDTGGVITSPNLAKRLNTNYFLRLEPYLWGTPEEIQFLNDSKTTINLTAQSLLQYGAFKQRVYWEQVPVPEPDWDYYSDNGFTEQVAILKSLLAQTDSYNLGVAYSIRTKGNFELQSPPEERMFEVITGYLASQMNGSSIQKGAKPIVVLSMDNFTNRTGGGETPVSQLINGKFCAQESSWNSELNPDLKLLKKFNITPTVVSEKRRNQLIQALKPHDYRAKYLKNVDAINRITYVWTATKQSVEAAYGFLNKANNRLLFVQLGRVPAPIFNYVMYKAALPSIFEGQNTGNLALQFGKPYFHVARPSSSGVQYPTTLLGYTLLDEVVDWDRYIPALDYVPSIVSQMQQIANQVNYRLEVWPSTASENPAEVIGEFIRDYYYAGSGAEDYKTYYKSIGAFYQKIANDKFRIGLGYLGYILQSDRVIAGNQNLTANAIANDDSNPLNALLGKLYDNLDENNNLNLFPGVYSAGQIFDFISGLLGVKLVLTGATVTPAKGTADPTDIIVTGNSSVLDSVPLAFTINFTAPEGSVLSAWKMTYTGNWLTSELPWLLFDQPYVLFTVADTLVPAQGGIGGILQGLDLDLSIRMPIEEGVWQLEGHFDAPASVSRFYQLAGGVNLVQALPSPFNAFAAIGVTDLQMAYDSNTKTIQYISFVMATAESVQLMQGLTMDSITFKVLITDPGSLSKRKTTWSIAGKFTIGTGDDAGVVTTGMSYPGPIISGQLVSGVIRVTDLFNLFLPGTVFDPEGYSPEITEFEASFDGTSGNYSVVCKLNFDWTFVVFSGAPSVTINEVGVRVQSKEKQLEGGISGGFTFGTGATAFSITLSATYDSKQGWVFSGQQDADNTLSLTNLANQLLPSNWQIPPQYEYGLKNLNFTFLETSKYYEIGGETDGYWTIPFVDLQIRADLKFGFGLYGADSSSSSETVLFVNKNNEAVAFADDQAGYYCMLNADIEWIGIKMNIFFNYNPDILEFGFVWGGLKGIIVEKEVDPGKPKHWIGTLTFTDSVTLGSIVEEAISWLTGYKFALASPWDLLNSLSLSALELIYDFTAKTVSFKLNIGEINLGFCKITAIGVNYVSKSTTTGGNGQSGQDTTDDSGVFITIDGSFFWLIGTDGANGQSADQIKWDASKPESTPAPSGQGNKYLDLRLLALGQHVTLPGFADATTVQKAIAAMKNLPPTEAGTIPDIIFDPNSSWLIGADFGILKLGDDSSGGQNQALAATGDDDGSGYFIDLQIVFNDPNLYALRIALSGAPARIFKGLDFQILYRKISDSVGVYQAQIALPDVMRKIQLGTVNITLPVFGIEIYTNGDFLVDLGFPYNADFSRSFTLQVVIYVPFPIPLMGSAGLYFGKKSSATSTEVPVIDNGTFNPVLLFGIGIQFGLGYDFNAGILAAGFSLTFVTIIEGVLAKFNPYQSQDISTGEQSDIAPAYYYSIKGVVGIQGKLYGYIDFKIIKAEVNIFISVLADITITAYKPIILGLTATVSVSVSVRINLGLFTIKISFSFDMTLRQSYEIKVGSGSSPWHEVPGGQQGNLKISADEFAGRQSFKMRTMAFAITVQDNFTDTPAWSNLSPAATKAGLTGYIGFGLSMAGDLATLLTEQLAVYSAMLFIQSVPPASQDAASAALKAQGSAADTSFEILAKQVFRWVLAAFHAGPIDSAGLDALPISAVRLQEIYDYLNDPDNNDPLPVSAIYDFLDNQVTLSVSHPSDNTGETDATYFPIAPQLSMSLPAFDQQPELNYSFDAFNTLSETYIHDLRIYFDELAVQMQETQNTGNLLKAKASIQNNNESLGTFIFADYFLLLARQMVQNAQDALSAFSYQMVAGQTPGDIVSWINANGQFNGYAYTVTDLFNNNKSHVLTTGKPMKVPQAVYGTVGNDTFNSISAKSIYNNGFTANSLATTNSGNTTILQNGLLLDYPAKDSIVIQSGNSLDSLAQGFKVSLNDLLTNARINKVNILAAEGLLMPSSKLTLPDFSAQTQAADTLVSFSARYGVSIDTLAVAAGNAAIVDLFDITDNSGKLVISDLPQFEIGELIKEIQANNGLQQLSGMASRYYLSGLRLPTTGITPNYQGMWVNAQMQYLEKTAGLFALTGQQFPLPVLPKDGSYTISFTIPSGLSWMLFDGGGSSLAITIDQSSDTYTQIDTVRSYFQSKYLDLAIAQLGLGDMFSGSYGHYSFNTVSVWQAGSLLLLPYGGSASESQSLNIWSLPSDLVNLADPTGRAIRPRFQVQTGTIDPVTKAMTAAPVNNYGWGTQVTFTVKKVPLSADSPSSATTYEISGADGNNALILEKMVTYLGNNDSLINLIALGYAPNQSNGSNPGIQTDPIGNLTIGIAQANLSTFTRPDSVSAKLLADAIGETEESNLLNTPTALITLLWQASITRDGGYYLYYYNSENDGGLPEHAFNDKGEAALTLVTIYTAPVKNEDQNLLQPYMNMFVTGDPVNAGESSVYAQANPIPQTATFAAGDTLSDLAFQYFTNVGDAVESNPGLVLTANLDINVPEGTYQVTNAQGETLQAIADKFGTSPDDIKSANPVVNTWPNVLPLYMGLRLPPLTIKSGSNDNTKSLDAIAAFYGMDITALANYNSGLIDLFPSGTNLRMIGGPVTRVATVPAGVVSLEAIREEPGDVPAHPTDKDYALLFLQHDFSILSFSLLANSWFKASNPSLPVGPTDSQTDANNSYVKTDETGKWIFKQSVPYYKFANQGALKSTGLPDISTSPYKGIGYLVQPDFTWLDIYGNTTLTTLSQPPATPGAVINETPILTGYTDPLLGVNQWPSVAIAWQAADTGQKEIQVLMSFDTTQYNGLLSAKAITSTSILLTFTEQVDVTTAQTVANYKLSPDLAVTSAVVGSGNKTVTLNVAAMGNELEYTLSIGNIKNTATPPATFNGQATFSYPDTPEAASSSIVQQAQHDFQVYTQLWYQLTDPNGMAMAMQTTLFADDFKLDSAAFNNLVNNWIAPIYLYLQDRSQGGLSVAAPQSEFTLHFAIDPAKVVDDQIFEVILSLSISRTGGAIMGDFETTGGVKQVTTNLAPVSNADSTVSRGLDQFADSFEAVMSIQNQYYLKIATGADRNKLGQQSTNGTIWAVRLGIDDSQAIAYRVTSPGEPDLFAPRPVSNKLESRSGVDIYNYTTGVGINFDQPDYQKDFTEIDLDQWIGVFFGSIDEILTPEFTAAIQLVDKKSGSAYLKDIQDSKESLADIAKLLMAPVFAGTSPDAAPVQEALKQALLVKLTNLYATNSGIQFDVKVKADPVTNTAPNFFGNFLQNTIFEGAVSGDDHFMQVSLYFSAPLDPDSAKDVSNYSLTAPIQVQLATLSNDAKSVVLLASENVTIGSTTVTIGPALVDANLRQIQGSKTETIATDYVSYSKPDQLTITAAKIKLDPAADQFLAFLLTTPEIVRGQDGEVLSKIALNLSYKATDIEHQIATPINGFTPSSWLSFVLPAVRVPLESQLGGFEIPMFLRSFPQNPSLDNQSGIAPYLDNPDISKLLQWDYIFNYSQSFHYPQDTLYFTVNFNVGSGVNAMFKSIPDAFSQLAEFITVFPSVNVDLTTMLTKIDAKAYYDTSPDAVKLFNDSGIALNSFVEMVQHIVTAASAGNSLMMNSVPKLFVSTSADPYSFEIREGAMSMNGRQVQVVSVYGAPPAGVGTPEVYIAPDTYDMKVWTSTEEPCPGFVCYYYTDKTTGEPLLSDVAQNIQQREVVLPEMNILQRQDAMTTVYLTRNEDLIQGKTTNPDFVYTTGNLAFSNPFLPTANSTQEIELADLPGNQGVPTNRTLYDQLKTLMDTLLAKNTEPSLSFQMVCSYEYAINQSLSPVNLPVLMQTMVPIVLATELDPMLQSWADNINAWFSSNDPNQLNGTLKFDLVIFSNLTKQPFPLVRLSGLSLGIVYIIGLG